MDLRDIRQSPGAEITETYSFLPREAVTRFLLNCSECRKRPTTPTVKNIEETEIRLKDIESIKSSNEDTENEENIYKTQNGVEKKYSITPIQNSPENLCKHTRNDKNDEIITSTPFYAEDVTDKTIETVKTKIGFIKDLDGSTGSDTTSDSSFENLINKPKLFRKPLGVNKVRKNIFQSKYYPPVNGRLYSYYSENLTKVMELSRRLVKEEISSAAEVDPPEEEPYGPNSATNKEAEKLKMMLLAWNAAGGRNGDVRMPEDMSDEPSSLWAGYHNAMSLAKSTPPTRGSPTQETSSVHDETSSSGNKDDDDDEEEEQEEKIDPKKYDPERLKAFNMFVRLFVDENLDRIVPISKQPKEKIQAIIDSCTRQFPEFSERARKRIRTYLKSCRRNKRCRDGNTPWEPVRQSRPTPAHLTSVQAEQLLAQACENESHNAKRMRLGLEPVTQPMPGATTDTVTVSTSRTHSNDNQRDRDIYTSPVTSTNNIDKHNLKMEGGGGGNSGSVSPTLPNKGCSLEALAMASANSLSPSLLNGSGPPMTTAGGVGSAAPTAMYRPNFSQAFQRAVTAGYTAPGLFSLPSSIANGATDLSMKNKPLLTHKLNPAEMTAVRQLITGYRESAAFLLRSADELEQLLRNQ